MRSPWSEAYEDVTPPPTDEERESNLRRAWVNALGALASGHDISRGQPGIDGRCRKHKIRDCRCEETTR
jgi:hypothetical protein